MNTLYRTAGNFCRTKLSRMAPKMKIRRCWPQSHDRTTGSPNLQILFSRMLGHATTKSAKISRYTVCVCTHMHTHTHTIHTNHLKSMGRLDKSPSLVNLAFRRHNCPLYRLRTEIPLWSREGLIAFYTDKQNQYQFE